MNQKSFFTQLLTAGLSATAATAAITYVDATTTNTSAVGIPVELGTEAWLKDDDASLGTDNLWNQRSTGPGAQSFGGQSFQAEPGENTPTLQTTVTGVAPGTYNVYVYYLSKFNYGYYPANTTTTPQTAEGYEWWVTRASLDNTNFTRFDATNGTYVNVSNDAVTPPTGNTTERRFRALIGTQTVDENGTITVYIDNAFGQGLTVNPGIGGSTSINAARTQYDGIGYELVPEPSSAVLLGLGALGLMRRKRA